MPDHHSLIQLSKLTSKRAILGALVALLAVPQAEAARTVAPTAQQISEYEKVDETQRIKLLIHLSRSGQQQLAAELLRLCPLTGQHAANRTLFIEGLIMKADGNLTGAVKTFRAALANDPRLTLVRAELAQTLVALDEDASAKHHLELLAAEAPTQAEADGIRSFVDQIDERSPYKFSFYVAAAPSTNVNNGSGHSTVYSPLFGSNLTISEDGRKTSGVGMLGGVNAAFQRRLGNDFSLVAAGNAEARIYNDSTFNTLSFSQSTELRYLLKRGYVGAGGVSSQLVDDDNLDMSYISFGPRTSIRLNLTGKDVLTASSTYEWRDYSGGTSSDGTAWLNDAAWTHSLNSALSLTLSGGYDDVKLELAQNSYDSWSVGGGVYSELPHGVTANLNGDVKFSEFGDTNLLAGVVRKDTRFVGSVGLTKRDINIFGFAPEVSYTYVRNASNISMYDYDSHNVDVRLTKDF